MIIYGLNPVLEALRSHPKRVHYVAVSREHGAKLQRAVAEAKKHGVPLRVVSGEQIDRLAGRGVHNGIVADVSETTYADFESVVERESTVFVLILDGITDPQNFGAILRVADGFGADLVVIPEHDSVGLTPAAVKASAGASRAGHEPGPRHRDVEESRLLGLRGGIRRRRARVHRLPRQSRPRPRQRRQGDPPQRARALRSRHHDSDDRSRRLVQCGDGGRGALLRSATPSSASAVTSETIPQTVTSGFS